jgi:hypothetical protein
MHVPVLLACPACAMQSPFFLGLSICVGGVLVSHLLLRPFVARVSRIWGWPRPSATCCVSLLPILAWPSLFCAIGLQSHGIVRVAICTSGLVLCAVYLWLRGAWLLQQCGVVAWFRQFLFLAILGPGMLIAGAVVGFGIVGLLLFGLAWPAAAIPWFLVHGGIGGVLGAILFGGLCYVFQQTNPICHSDSSDAERQSPAAAC